MKELIRYNILLWLILTLTAVAVSGQEDTTLEFENKDSKYIKTFFKEVTSGENRQKAEEELNNTQKKISKFASIYRTIHKEHNTLFGEDQIELTETEKLRGYKLSDRVEVFGWHPYWMGEAYTSYNYNLLSTISFFSYDVHPESGMPRSSKSILQWKTTGLVDSAQVAGCDVLLSVTCHGFTDNRIFLDNQYRQQDALIDTLLSLLDLRQANGIDVDFEAIPLGYDSKFTAFIKKLSIRLKAHNPDYIISLAIPAVDHNRVFRIRTLNKLVDKFVMMGYDYHGSTSPNAGPIAPLHDPAYPTKGYDLSRSVDTYLKAGVPYSKFILGLPYYGGLWSSENVNFAEAYFDRHLTFKQIKALYPDTVNMEFEPSTTSVSYFSKSDSLYHLLYFDNSTTLGMKYRWMLKKGLAGIGIWALGYDNGHNELWQAIADNLSEEAISGGPKLFTLGAFVLRYRDLIVVTVTFLLSFMILGFILALFSWKIRDAFFVSQTFRVVYILIFSMLCIVLMAQFRIVEDRNLLFLVGLSAGVLITYLAFRISNLYSVKSP